MALGYEPYEAVAESWDGRELCAPEGWEVLSSGCCACRVENDAALVGFAEALVLVLECHRSRNSASEPAGGGTRWPAV